MHPTWQLIAKYENYFKDEYLIIWKHNNIFLRFTE